LLWGPFGRFAERRHAHHLPRFDAVAGLGTLAVEPDLAGAQQLLQPAVAEPGEVPLEPAVEPLVRVFLSDLDLLHAAHGRETARKAG
jgi:hypothetical protein